MMEIFQSLIWIFAFSLSFQFDHSTYLPFLYRYCLFSNYNGFKVYISNVFYYSKQYDTKSYVHNTLCVESMNLTLKYLHNCCVLFFPTFTNPFLFTSISIIIFHQVLYYSHLEYLLDFIILIFRLSRVLFQLSFYRILLIWLNFFYLGLGLIPVCLASLFCWWWYPAFSPNFGRFAILFTSVFTSYRI